MNNINSIYYNKLPIDETVKELPVKDIHKLLEMENIRVSNLQRNKYRGQTHQQNINACKDRVQKCSEILERIEMNEFTGWIKPGEYGRHIDKKDGLYTFWIYPWYVRWFLLKPIKLTQTILWFCGIAVHDSVFNMCTPDDNCCNETGRKTFIRINGGHKKIHHDNITNRN